MKGYSTSAVASLLGVSVAQVRAWAEVLEIEREADGSYRFRFRDLVLLRTAKGLADAKVPAAAIKRALTKLRSQLPEGRPLTGVRIAADGKRVVVQDGASAWYPESGQTLFDFAVADLATAAAPHAKRAAEAARQEGGRLSADDWYRLGCDVEASSPADARDAYRRAVELEPHHADAHVNLGRLLHEQGKIGAAEVHYRIALTSKPKHAAAAFNLGVALEDRGHWREAAQAYERAVASDPGMADAHYNAALLYERAGNKAAAIRHLKACRKLADPR
ncbi:MAG: tetratricopeptide repeat protein [Acidobacteriota bacterium]